MVVRKRLRKANEMSTFFDLELTTVDKWEIDGECIAERIV